jgi:hypothetical protein
MKQFAWPAVGLVCIACYYSLVIYNSQNIPFADDLAIMATLYDVRTDNSLSNQLAGLLSFHNEHRLLLPRLLAMGLAKLNGGVIDIRWWIWSGNALLLLILLLLYRVFAHHKKPFVYFIPVILLLFQPVWTELTYWGMASVQNIGVLALSALVLYDVSGSSPSWPRLAGEFLVTGAAMLTGANGLLLLVSVAFVLLVRGRYKQASAWVLAGGLSVKLYWLGFVADPGLPSQALPASGILDKCRSLAGLLGAFFDSQRFDFLPVGIGLCFLGLFTYVGLQKLRSVLRSPGQLPDRPALFVLGYSSFLLLTMSAISVNRDVEAVLHVSRYKIYSVLLLICLYLLSLEYLQGRIRLLQLLIVLSFVYNVAAYGRSWPAIRQHRVYLTDRLNDWLMNGKVEAPSAFMKAYYRQRWTQTYRDGLYKPPATL